MKAGDIDRQVAAIEPLRSRVTRAARNPVLSDTIERIYDRTRITIRRVALLPGRSAAGILQYRAVLAAIICGDADEAEQRIRELNRDARAYIGRYNDYVIQANAYRPSAERCPILEMAADRKADISNGGKGPGAEPGRASPPISAMRGPTCSGRSARPGRRPGSRHALR